MIAREKDGAVNIYPRRGFTTLELLVVIAILLILAAIALPNLSGWARNQRLKGVARDLMSHFQFARLEAIKSSTTVVLTFYPDLGLIKGSYIVSKDGVTLIDVRMPAGVTLDSTTFTADQAGYNSRGFPVLGAGGGGWVELRTDPPGRTYRVIMQHTSGHELPAPTADMTVLPGVLGCRTLRRTVQVRLGSNPLRLPGGTLISTVSRRKFVKYPGLAWILTIIRISWRDGTCRTQ
jgi:type IV fimbrial biogenesis protein FimT